MAGAAGPAPEIKVEEDTPTGYKVSFKTDDQKILSPNLKSNMECYNTNLSATGSSLDIPMESLILTVQNTSASSIRISVRPKDSAVPVLTDIRRASIYSGSSIETQTNDNTKVTGVLVLDDLVYSQSQEMHWIRLRQQDPADSLWSMCEISTFVSMGGARTSVCVNWFYVGASFQAP